MSWGRHDRDHEMPQIPLGRMLVNHRLLLGFLLSAKERKPGNEVTMWLPLSPPSLEIGAKQGHVTFLHTFNSSTTTLHSIP